MVLGTLAWASGGTPSVRALANCDVSDSGLDGEEQNFLRLINAYRAGNGAGALTTDAALTRAATWMATDLASGSNFSHTDSLGRSPWTRMADCGVGSPAGENLAGGTNYASARAALDAWLASPSHHALVIDREFTTIGIARVFGQGSRYGWYWVTDFGYGGAPAAPPPPPPAPAAAPAAPPAPAAADPAAPAAPAVRTLAIDGGITLVEWGGGYVSPQAAFAPLSDSVSMVYVFDIGTERWLRWGPALDTNLQTLAELRTGVSYWVVASQAGEIVVLD